MGIDRHKLIYQFCEVNGTQYFIFDNMFRRSWLIVSHFVLCVSVLRTNVIQCSSEPSQTNIYSGKRNRLNWSAGARFSARAACYYFHFRSTFFWSWWLVPQLPPKMSQYLRHIQQIVLFLLFFIILSFSLLGSRFMTLITHTHTGFAVNVLDKA